MSFGQRGGVLSRTVIRFSAWLPAAEAVVPHVGTRVSRRRVTRSLMRIITRTGHVVEQVSPAGGIAAFISVIIRH